MEDFLGDNEGEEVFKIEDGDCDCGDLEKELVDSEFELIGWGRISLILRTLRWEFVS
jgi:hypothetical protein